MDTNRSGDGSRPAPRLRHRLSKMALVIAGAGVFAGCGERPAATPAAPTSASVVERLEEAMGGRAALDEIASLRFTFEVLQDETVTTSRRWTWDRRKGRVRLDLDTDDGAVSILVDLATQTGIALHKGVPAEEDQEELVEYAYRNWVNDEYWLLMPWKLRDPGVALKLHDDVRIDERTHRFLEVSFLPGTGLTPHDVYHHFIDAESGLITRFAFRLQAMTPEQPMSQFDWTDWTEVGGVRFSMTRRMLGREQVVRFRDVEVIDTLPDEIFEALPSR